MEVVVQDANIHDKDRMLGFSMLSNCSKFDESLEVSFILCIYIVCVSIKLFKD